MKNNLILSLVIVALFSITFVAAADWDNKLTYSNEDLKVDLNNWFGLGKDYGSFELKSHSSINEIKEVTQGNSVVMWYDFDFNEKYTNGLGDVEFTDEITGKKVNRDYKFVYEWSGLADEYKRIIDYETLENGTKQEKGTHSEYIGQVQKTEWRDFNSKDIPAGKIRIGIQVEVRGGDYIDGVWTIGGKKVSKHASWTSDLNTGLVEYWTYDTINSTGNGTFGNLSGTFNRNVVNTTNGAPFIAGKINNAINITSAGNYTAYNTSSNLSGNATWTINFWVKPQALSANDYIWFASTALGGGSDRLGLYADTTMRMEFRYANNTLQSFAMNRTLVVNQWTMVTITSNGSGFQVWLNGSMVGSTPIASNNEWGALYQHNPRFNIISGSMAFDGGGFWNVTLNETQIGTNLYNGATGNDYVPTNNPPSVTLNQPANSSTTFSPNVVFNITGSDDITLQNLSLIVDGTRVSTNSSPINNTLTSFPYTLTSTGFHNWSGEACDSIGQCTTASYFHIWYNNSIAITLNAPINVYNSTSQNIIFNATGIDDTTLQNISFILNGSYNGTNTSVYNNTLTQFPRNLADGFYNWTAEACDNNGICVNATARNFSVDTQNPAVSSNGTTTYTFQQKDTNLLLYYTITDTNRDSCWIQWYNGTNASITCATGSVSVNTTGFNTPRNLSFWGNDTFGRSNSSFINWSYKLFLENETYVPHALEGSSNNFTLQVLTNGTTITLANLSYNNEQNLGSLSSGTNYTIYKPVAAPLVTSDTNYTFFWNISFGDGTYYAIPSHQQNVTNLGIGNCSYFTNVIYNFTLKDEETQTELNETALSNIGGFVDIDLRVFGDTDVVSNFSQTYNQTNPFAVCTNTTLSSGQQYNIDTQVQYFATGYSTELYHIQNATLNSSTLNQNITLYDLLTTSTQIFELIFKSSSFLPVEDALIQIERKYINEGVFKVVEIPKTDANGETDAHLQLNNVIYNFVIKKYGVTLATFSNVIPVCQTPSITPCVIDFNAVADSIELPEYSTAKDFNFTLGYNSSSREVTSVFVIPSGSASVVSLNVTSENVLGTSICSDIVNSNAGTLSCSVPSTFGNTTIIAKLYRDGQQISSGQVKLDQTPNSIYGLSLVVIGLIAMLTLIGLAVTDSGAISLVLLVLGIITIFSINLVQNNGFFGTTATILYIIVAIVLVLIKASRRER